MMRYVYWIILTCFITAIVHLTWVSVVPQLIAERNLERFEALDEERIVWVIEQEDVQNYLNYANPSMIYAYCKFDVSEKGLQINAHMPGTYWVINMYTKHAHNFYVLSHNQAEVNDLVFLLRKKKNEDEEDAGEISTLSDQAINIQTSSDTGLILLRAFVPFESQAESIKTKLASTSCTPI